MKEFIWTDELVKEFAARVILSSGGTAQTVMEEFKKSKEPKPEWEILSFKSSLGFVCYKCSDGRYAYPTHGGWELEVMLSDKTNIINSVKRLSDGEVISVGDKGIMGKIVEKFFIGWAGMEVHFTDGLGIRLSEFVKYKAPERIPLFSDFHGNKVYDGDRIYYVLINDGFQIHSNPVNCFDGINPNYKYFLKESDAKEYVLMNKPIFSLKEVLKYTVWYEHTESAKKLAKEKLKL